MRKFDASRLPSTAAKDAAEWVQRECRRSGHPFVRPQVGIILGSGLNELLSKMVVQQRISYAAIPHFAQTTVTGHAGRLELGTAEGMPIAVLRGRYHLYEGHSADKLVLPVRMLRELGVETLIVTNAAGGLNPDFHRGDLMLMRDHIGLPTLAGYNPLVGPNDDALGPRFTPMGAAYDPDLLKFVQGIAQKAHVGLREGVYVMVSGPTYETPAEIRALRSMGADAVGMSTVPEVIAARHMGMRVLGISCITNAATPEAAPSVNHEEVLIGAAATLPKLDHLLTAFLGALKSHDVAANSAIVHSVVTPFAADVDSSDDEPTAPDLKAFPAHAAKRRVMT